MANVSSTLLRLSESLESHPKEGILLPLSCLCYCCYVAPFHNMSIVFIAPKQDFVCVDIDPGYPIHDDNSAILYKFDITIDPLIDRKHFKK